MFKIKEKESEQPGIPISLFEYKVKIFEVLDHLEKFEEVVSSAKDLSNISSVRASIPSGSYGRNYHFEISLVNPDSQYDFRLDYWQNGRRYFVKFRFSESDDELAKVRYEERFPPEIEDYLSARLNQLYSILGPLSTSLSERKEAEHLSKMTEEERVEYKLQKQEDARYHQLASSIRSLTDSEAQELFSIKKKREKRHRKKKRDEKREAEKQREDLKQKLEDSSIDDIREKYLISNDDYKRGSDKERTYLRVHRATLLRVYDNRCAACGDDENGLDIDHFFFSKNEGGCFAMTHIDGHLVNNAVPLCESCNRSKSDKHYRTFFSAEVLLRILGMNVKMTKRLNKKER